jgi:hypothetical protein
MPNREKVITEQRIACNHYFLSLLGFNYNADQYSCRQPVARCEKRSD